MPEKTELDLNAMPPGAEEIRKEVIQRARGVFREGASIGVKIFPQLGLQLADGRISVSICVVENNYIVVMPVGPAR